MTVTIYLNTFDIFLQFLSGQISFFLAFGSEKKYIFRLALVNQKWIKFELSHENGAQFHVFSPLVCHYFFTIQIDYYREL